MAGKSNIEWCEHTWNPIVGCSILSPGCTNCYAMKMAARIEAMKSSHYDGTTKRVNGNAVWTGKLALAPDHILLEPLRRKKPTTYFVNSMGDLFHEDAPDEWIDKVFAVMALCPQHTFQVLTKRAERMREWVSGTDVPDGMWDKVIGRKCHEIMCDHFSASARQRWLDDPSDYLPPWPLPNVWLGVSTERQQEADERIPLLLQTPAAVRFVSAEPLIGPINFMSQQDSLLGGETGVRLDWIIVGGESGPGARPMHPDWARLIRDQCAVAGVAFFFKQWGALEPILAADDGFSAYGDDADMLRDAWRSCAVVWPDGRVEHPRATLDYWDKEFDTNDDADTVALTKCAIVMHRVGKARAGRLLDSTEHNAMPSNVREA